MKTLSKIEIGSINDYLINCDPEHKSIYDAARGIGDTVDDYICDPKECPTGIPLEIIIDAIYLLRNV